MKKTDPPRKINRVSDPNSLCKGKFKMTVVQLEMKNDRKKVKMQNELKLATHIADILFKK